ncbi:MAG: hypothetical protein AVDCRST_MAG30-1071 [uncultured Solirubrobacteraceae bacterium]|uniref:Uncharacterized protein n=1 Tax=uncultured Solirubrobacteraceae bacterium TaxID=1162706 RepID=A0A6J4RZ17_9ACTN|nr:MAG: hypothetical protein AVDCRST_MAG30-1071 [uncultured Solirubrobacteraceae bacterium]
MVTGEPAGGALPVLGRDERQQPGREHHGRDDGAAGHVERRLAQLEDRRQRGLEDELPRLPAPALERLDEHRLPRVDDLLEVGVAERAQPAGRVEVRVLASVLDDVRPKLMERPSDLGADRRVGAAGIGAHGREATGERSGTSQMSAIT